MAHGGTVIAAVDIGSITKTGWWRIGTDGTASGGRRLDDLCDRLAEDLAAGAAVALGFEAPLWVPLATSSEQLGKARNGDGARSWSAMAGPVVLAGALQQVPYALARIAAAVSAPPVTTLDVGELVAGSADLLVWEAFVSAKAKDRAAEDPHEADARAAAEEFARRLKAGDVESDVVRVPAISIAGAALLVAGLATNLALLTTPTVVVKAPDRAPQPHLPGS